MFAAGRTFEESKDQYAAERRRVREAFRLFDKEDKKIVPKE